MVMAYFIQVRKIALLDIFKYLQSIRTVVEPNKHFLFQLAELEVNSRGVIVIMLSRILLTQLLVLFDLFPQIHQGMGSSVFYHKLWRAYEYNNIRGDITILRDCEGVYSTAYRIHSEENAALDLVDDFEAELERRALAGV